MREQQDSFLADVLEDDRSQLPMKWTDRYGDHEYEFDLHESVSPYDGLTYLHGHANTRYSGYGACFPSIPEAIRKLQGWAASNSEWETKNYPGGRK